MVLLYNTETRYKTEKDENIILCIRLEKPKRGSRAPRQFYDRIAWRLCCRKIISLYIYKINSEKKHHYFGEI